MLNFNSDKGIFITYLITIAFNLTIIFFIVNFPLSANSSSELNNTTKTETKVNNDDSNTPWYQVIGIASIISGGVSAGLTALFNYRITLKQIQENHNSALKELKEGHKYDLEQLKETYKNAIDEMKKDKLMQEIKEQRILYASLISRLSKIKKIENQTHLEASLEEIDLLIKDKYHLLSSESMEKWLAVFPDYSKLEELDELITELKKEYNSIIITNYKDIFGFEIKPIPN